jgi:hypothetical protein
MCVAAALGCGTGEIDVSYGGSGGHGEAGRGGGAGADSTPDAREAGQEDASAMGATIAPEASGPTVEASTGDGADTIGSNDASYPPYDGGYGGIGQLVLIPLQYTAQPVPPIVPPDCPDDPTAGFTEYRDSFVVQRPYDLAAADRFKYEDGIYTFWVFPNDKPHAMSNTTAPRTEARFSDMSTGQHIWSADVLFESPLNHTCIEQIHNVVGAIATYWRVEGGRMFNLVTGKTVLTDYYDKWFNMKVAFDTQTRQVNVYINNCLKESSTAPKGTPYWYFKHGVYTCNATICRDHYKNVHLYEKNSTDKYNVMSSYK